MTATPCEYTLVEKPLIDLLNNEYGPLDGQPGYVYIPPAEHTKYRGTRENEVLFTPAPHQQHPKVVAKSIFKKHPHLNVRSAGTSFKAKRETTESDIAWAHTIFAMETKHRGQFTGCGLIF